MRQAFVVAQPRHAALRALNYEPAVERLRRPRRGRTSTPLRDLVADLGSGYATVFARLDCDRTHGVELLSQSDMFAAEPEGRVIRIDSMQRPERHLVEKWDVLIAGAGTLAPTELYGRALIADDRLVGRYVGQDSMRLRFKEPQSDEALFAYALLASAMGLRALRSTSYGTKILRIRKDVLAELPIPKTDEGVMTAVARFIRRAVAERGAYSAELQLATQTLVDAAPQLGSSTGLFGRGAWEADIASATTLTARTHRPALNAFRRGAPLHDLVDGGTPRKANRFARVPSAAGIGVPFLGQRDLFLIRPSPQYIRASATTDSLAARPRSIVIAAAGQTGEGTLFGRSELGDFFDGLLISEHALHLDLSGGRIDHRYLLAVLRTPWGIGALKACATGTSVPSLDPTLLMGLHVPRLDSKVERRVAEVVTKAYEARRSASEAEHEAIRLIEEEVLPAWLD